MNIEKIDINLIKPYVGNAKRHPKKQIEKIKSIKQFIAIKSAKNIIESRYDDIY